MNREHESRCSGSLVYKIDTKYQITSFSFDSIFCSHRQVVEDMTFIRGLCDISFTILQLGRTVILKGIQHPQYILKVETKGAIYNYIVKVVSWLVL